MSAKRGVSSATQRRFRYYVAVSMDGFIADADGGVGWLKPFHDRDYGFGALMKAVDAEVVGRRTWEWAVQMTGKRASNLPTFVLTGTPETQPAMDGVTFFSDPAALSAKLRAEPGKDIWVVGGGSSAAAMLEAGALDVIDMHVMPVVLGAGKPLFGPLSHSHPFALVEHSSYPNGVMRLLYEVRR